MRREGDLKEVCSAAERFVAGIAVDEQDIELIAHLHDRVKGVVIGEAVAFETDGERMVADFVKRMGEGEHRLAFRSERYTRGAEACAVGFEMHGNVLPGAFAVVLNAHPQTDGLGLGCDERGYVGAGDAEVFSEIATYAEEGDLRLGLLLGESFERRQCDTVGNSFPVSFLEIGDDDDFARRIG